MSLLQRFTVFEIKIKLRTMPRYHKTDLLSSPLDTPELPPGHPEQQPHGYAGSGYQEDPYAHYYDPVRTLISWKAPSRPYRKKERSYYTTVALLIVLVSMIAFFWGERLLIGALLALGFLVYVLNFTPPQDIEYKVSTQGITIGDHFYHWEELDSFWFSKKEGQNIFNVLTKFRFPGLLMLVMGDTPEEELKTVTARYLPFHEIAPKSTLEKWSESLQKNFPLETPHK